MNVLVVVGMRFIVVSGYVEVQSRVCEFTVSSLSPMRRWPPVPMHKISQHPSIDWVALVMAATQIVGIMVTVSLPLLLLFGGSTIE